MPGRLILIGGCLAVLIAGTAPGFARTAKCLLVVDGKTYIDGPCDFTATKEQFEISNRGTGKGLFFAIVDIEPEGAEGFWNAERGATHAHSRLGPLKRQGGCWVNDRAKVCAWAKRK